MKRLACLAALAFVSAAPAWAQPTDVLADSRSCLLKPRKVIQLGSPVFGVLSNVLVDRATMVTKGQLVAKLDTSVEEAQLDLDRFRAANTTAIEAAQTDLAWNERELARRQKIAGNMFSKANDIDEVATKVDQDKISIQKAIAEQRTAALEAAKSAAQLNLKLIRSPVDGVVSEIKLEPGEFIYETTPIMTIVQYDPLTVDITMPAERYRQLRPGTLAQVSLAEPVNTTMRATVDVIDPVIDAASDTFRVRLLLPNPGNAIPAGVRCSARFPDASNG
jgi:RND family efflux transporter MFP subunit